MDQNLATALIAPLSTLVAALGGVGISGLIAARRQKKAFEHERKRDGDLREYERERERRQLHREKLELIATTANEIIAAVERLYGHLLKGALAVPGESSDETSRMAMEELRRLEMELTGLPTHYLKMLVDFYARELMDQVTEISIATGKLTESLGKVLDGETSGIRRQRLKDFGEEVLLLEGACRKLRRAAAEQAQQL